MAMPDPMAETMPVDPAMGGNPDNPNNLDENMVNEAMMAAAQDFGNVDDADDYRYQCWQIHAHQGQQLIKVIDQNRSQEKLNLKK